MDWVLARQWRPRKTPALKKGRRPLRWGRWSLAAASLAWLLPMTLLCWQVSRSAGDSAFQEAPGHSASWLQQRVGPPQRVLRFNQNYRIWCYTRGSYQIEVAVDQHAQVRGVGYGRI
ncbi:hypothetical protein JST97_17240 [bacterium]|nr:hypothetical protein [bacterium]